MQLTKHKDTLSKILVVRNDKLGDLLVSFSSFAVLKKNLPETEIHVLVSNYTAPMAKMCSYIDKVIIDPDAEKASIWNRASRLKTTLQQEQYQAIITLFSSFHVGLAAFLAKIPIRIAPATKIHQIFYNYRVTQRRSRSEKPEHRYNQDLAEYFLSIKHLSPLKTVKPPFLKFNQDIISKLKTEFLLKHNLSKDHIIIFLHPGSGGSARNLSANQYAQLANHLSSTKPFVIVVSHGPNEEKIAENVYQQLSTEKILYASKDGLEKFSQHLQFVDCFISGSTGPLHIAGALNTPTAGFYTNRRSATSLRWQTLNSDENRLAFSPPESANEEDMSSIDIILAANKISERFLK